MEGFPIPWAQLTFAKTLGTVSRYMENSKEQTIRKVMWGGGGGWGFRAAGIYFRYQIPCRNFFKAIV